ncbi:hypothetical protein NQ317_019189 [Molorchus minor]|uniref:C2H2-type domain-containing protein n=1 Tax=Molorchus minor TaxID=1323400 RepID=A0ABQ9J5R0_9CUCU|nr:hypothetical protein NQ317_019189 [Molorchus minor]
MISDTDESIKYVEADEDEVKNNLKEDEKPEKATKRVYIYNLNKILKGKTKKQCYVNNDKMDYHQLNHENSADIEMKKCYFCDFQSRHRGNLIRHIQTHREFDDSDKIKCKECDFLAKNKERLRRHMLTHVDPLDMKVFRCTVCAYQSKYRSGLKIHMIIHQDPANAVTYHCDICSYKTIRKEMLPKHKKRHLKKTQI